VLSAGHFTPEADRKVMFLLRDRKLARVMHWNFYVSRFLTFMCARAAFAWIYDEEMALGSWTQTFCSANGGIQKHKHLYSCNSLNWCWESLQPYVHSSLVHDFCCCVIMLTWSRLPKIYGVVRREFLKNCSIVSSVLCDIFATVYICGGIQTLGYM